MVPLGDEIRMVLKPNNMAQRKLRLSQTTHLKGDKVETACLGVQTSKAESQASPLQKACLKSFQDGP